MQVQQGIAFPDPFRQRGMAERLTVENEGESVLFHHFAEAHMAEQIIAEDRDLQTGER